MCERASRQEFCRYGINCRYRHPGLLRPRVHVRNGHNDNPKIDSIRKKRTQERLQGQTNQEEAPRMERRNNNYQLEAPQKHEIISIKGDGNCLFRTLSQALYKNQDKHESIRDQIGREVENNRDKYSKYIDNEGFEEHITNMKFTDGRIQSYGTLAEMYAASKLYNCDLFVYTKTGHEYMWNRVSHEIKCHHSKRFICIKHEGEHFDFVKRSVRPCTCTVHAKQNNAVLRQRKDILNERNEEIPWKYNAIGTNQSDTTNQTQPQNGRNDETEENFLCIRLGKLERQVQQLRKELVWSRDHRGKLERQVQQLRKELRWTREHRV